MITGTIQACASVTASVDAQGGITADMGNARAPSAPPYDGPYEATPSQDEQTFATDGLRMVGDFKVKPIPSNYGLITWDGSTLMVS